MEPTLMSLSVWIIVGVVLLYSIRWYNKAAKRKLESIYSEMIKTDTSPADVLVTFHTYYGVLAWVDQQTHQFHLPPTEAKEVLRRLRNFNLKWGILAYGFVFIPFLTFFNYWSQLRSIQNQIASRSTPLG
jgi:hypothetical protein